VPPVVALVVVLSVLLTPGIASPFGGRVAAGAAISARYLVVAPSAAIPAHASALGAVPGAERLSFELLLAPRNPERLDALVRAVTTAGDPAFRHYLHKGEFARLFGTSTGDYDELSGELRRLGLHPGGLSANGLVLGVQGTVAEVEAAFRTKLSAFGLPSGGHLVANVDPVELPGAIAPLVEGVLGLTSAPAVAPVGLARIADRARSAPATPQLSARGAPAPTTACAAAIATAYGSTSAGFTADQIASTYGLDGLYGAGDLGAGTTIGVIEFSTYVAGDLAAYSSCYGVQPSVSAVPVDGGPTNPDPASTVEAELDIEDLIGLAPLANMIVYEGRNSGGVTNQAAFDTFSAAVDADVAQVITTSWGSCEAALGTSVAKEENTLFEQAALQGQTIIAAAGDSGSEDCNGTIRGSEGSALAVDDPASQPFVTGVGGTTLSLSPAREEVVWNTGEASPSPGAGGGGLSSLWPMPPYQSDTPPSLGVVTAASQGRCSSTSGDCREVPDVTANAGAPYAVYCTIAGLCGRTGWTGLGGTSASAPTWAAIIALADSSSACAPTRPLGFINPALYAIGSGPGYSGGFYDVVSGNNDLTGTDSGDYAAGPGYDLASGLGSPNAGDGSDNGLVAQLCSPVVEAAVTPNSGLPRPVISKVAPGSVRSVGGARVKLKGTNLEDATRVVVGSTALSAGAFKDVSATEIEAVVPAGIGRLHITVTTRAGTSSPHRGDTLAYLAVPVLTRLAPPRGPANGGESVVLIGSGLSGATSVMFGAVSASFVVRSPTRIVAIAPRGSGTVVVTVRTRAGRDVKTSIDRFTYRS